MLEPDPVRVVQGVDATEGRRQRRRVGKGQGMRGDAASEWVRPIRMIRERDHLMPAIQQPSRDVPPAEPEGTCDRIALHRATHRYPVFRLNWLLSSNTFIGVGCSGVDPSGGSTQAGAPEGVGSAVG